MLDCRDAESRQGLSSRVIPDTAPRNSHGESSEYLRRGKFSAIASARQEYQPSCGCRRIIAIGVSQEHTEQHHQEALRQRVMEFPRTVIRAGTALAPGGPTVK